MLKFCEAFTIGDEDVVVGLGLSETEIERLRAEPIRINLERYTGHPGHVVIFWVGIHEILEQALRRVGLINSETQIELRKEGQPT